MNNHSCEQEQAIAAAVGMGRLDATQLAHAADCHICADVLLVAEFLQTDSTSLERDLNIPDAAVLWKKGQLRAQEKAIAKATMPIRIARISALVISAISLLCLLVSLPNASSWFPDVTRFLTIVELSFYSAAASSLLLGTIGGLLLITLSSWYVLREE